MGTFAKKLRPGHTSDSDGWAAGSCRALEPGDAIDVFFKGSLVHRGTVLGAAPGEGLVWMLDTLTGDRCLLNLPELEIVRLAPRYREVRVGGAARW